ncbi:hypothetical protein EIP86_007510 [Pleurotus ostreatoroseus]|nr:hypothetical protein EIP86_007510 [Pleurotus ostreatoroseus]
MTTDPWIEDRLDGKPWVAGSGPDFNFYENDAPPDVEDDDDDTPPDAGQGEDDTQPGVENDQDDAQPDAADDEDSDRRDVESDKDDVKQDSSAQDCESVNDEDQQSDNESNETGRWFTALHIAESRLRHSALTAREHSELVKISMFFERNASATQEECNLKAEQLTGQSVYPTLMQGASSYTVISSDEICVVQFRAGDSALDLKFLECIEQAYNGYTARHSSVGNLGELHVYTMGNVGGVPMYLARDQLNQNNFRLLTQTVEDFARFFASAWNNTPSHMACPSHISLLSEYSSKLSQLQAGLPERFRSTLDHLISMLPRLLAENWPLVPNHTDLLENNIHVSKETGRLAGICDWKDAVIGPFGMSLGWLETMLGKRTMSWGWRYHPNQQELRDLFWKTLYEAIGDVSEEQKKLIDVARLVDLFLTNGFVWKDEVRVPASEGDDDLIYLEAVTLALWEQTGKQYWQ